MVIIKTKTSTKQNPIMPSSRTDDERQEHILRCNNISQNTKAKERISHKHYETGMFIIMPQKVTKKS